MNVRAMTVFFWGGLVATATVVSAEHSAEFEMAVDHDRPEIAVTRSLAAPGFSGGNCEPDGTMQVHGNHQVKVWKNTANTTN